MYAGGAGCSSHHFLPKLSATLRGPQWAPLWGTHMGTLSGTHFLVTLRDLFSLRAPAGPLIGTLIGPPLFKINIMFYVAHMWGTMPIEQSVPMENYCERLPIVK